MVLFVHSSAGRYGADRQLALMVERLDSAATVWLALDGPLAGELRALGATVEVRPLPVLRRAELSPRGLWRLGRAARSLALPPGIAIVHANTSVIRGTTGRGVPSVVHVREIYPRWALPAVRRLLRRADAVVCVSEAVRAQELHPRARVIHDGLAYAPARADRPAARAALGLPGDAFVVAVAGRISSWKGQELLARALGAVPDAIGIVAGDEWPGSGAEAALRRAAEPLGDRFRLLGFRDDVETVYGAADVVVVPSTRPDPFPNAALEAAAAGCCVVAAAHGGLPEMLRDGVTARLFVPGDGEALAAVLAQLRDDRSQVERLGAAAAREIPERFAPERMAAELAALYRELT